MNPVHIRKIVLALSINLILADAKLFGVTVTYENLQTYFQKDHPLLTPDSLNIKEVQARKGVLSRSFIPSFKASIGYESFSSPVFGEDQSKYYSTESVINLYQGGRDLIADQLVILEEEIAQLSLEEKLHHLFAKANHIFWKIAAKMEKLKYLESSEKALDQVRRRMIPKVQSGIESPSELSGLKLKQSELEFLKQKLQIEINQSKSHLAYLLGLGSKRDNSISLKYNHVWSKPLHALQDVQHNELNHIKRIEKLKDRLNLEAKSDSYTSRPTIDFYGSYGLTPFRNREYSNPSDRQETFIGVRISFSISEIFLSRPVIESKQLKAAALQAQKSLEENRLQYIRNKLQEDLYGKILLEKKLEKIISEKRGYYQQRLDEYERGVGSSSGLTDLLTSIQANELEKIDHKKNMLLLTECLRHIESSELCI